MEITGKKLETYLNLEGTIHAGDDMSSAEAVSWEVMEKKPYKWRLSRGWKGQCKTCDSWEHKLR